MEKICFNGLNLSCQPIISDIDKKEIYDFILSSESQEESAKKSIIYATLMRFLGNKAFLGWPIIDFDDLSKAGWGVIVPSSEFDNNIVSSIAKLIEYRSSQVGKPFEKMLFNYHNGETATEWLKRYGIQHGEPDPSKVPYYLLILGAPNQIPLSFQQDLTQYSTGRLALNSLKEYENYATNVVRYEREIQPIKTGQKWVFISPRHDNYTRQSNNFSTNIVSNINRKEKDGETLFLNGNEATKQNFQNLFSNSSSNTELVFFTGHGIHHFPATIEEQKLWQGAFVLQPGNSSNIFSSQDVVGGFNLNNNIVFTTACYGACTPDISDYAHWWQFSNSSSIIETRNSWESFLCSLPQKIIGNESPALAFVGHSDIFSSLSLTANIYVQILNEIQEGIRLGHVLRHFRERTVTKSYHISEWIDARYKHGMQPNIESLVNDWIIRNDSRNFILIGDPAISLRKRN